MKNKSVYRKGVPTNNLYLKEELLRIVKTKEGLIKIDLDQTIKGRGVYLIKDIKHLPLIKKKHLIEKGLKEKSSLDYLYEEIEQLLK